MKPNILILLMDSVRAKNTSLHGYHRDTTPFLKEFAESEASKYTQARSPAYTSYESHASIYTGLYPSEHGMTEYEHELKPGTTIWEELQSKYEYSTGVFSTNNFTTGEDYGLGRGFETVVSSTELLNDLPFERGLDPRIHFTGSIPDYLQTSIHSNHPIASLLNAIAVRVNNRWRDLPGIVSGDDRYELQFLKWMKRQQRPWAACINFHDAHVPYLPEPEHDIWGGSLLKKLFRKYGTGYGTYAGEKPWWIPEAYESLYDGGIHQVDARISRIVDELRTQGQFQNTLIVISADHGEAFGERDRVRPNVRLLGHGPGTHECKFHVPLIVKYPSQNRPTVIKEFASLVQFPHVVRGAIENRVRDFVPEDHVVVESAGINCRTTTIPPGMERLVDDAIGVYVDDNETKTKYAKWGPDTGAVRIESAQTSVSVDSDDIKSFIDTRRKRFTDADVLKAEKSTLSDSSRRQLIRMGYIDA